MALLEYKDFRMGGFVAWVAWAGIHLFLLLGVKNKLNVFWEWFWNYITWDMPTRIIMVPHEKTAQLQPAKPRSRSPQPAGRTGQAKDGKNAGDEASEKVDTSKNTGPSRTRKQAPSRKPSGQRKQAPKKEKVLA
ncbi:MAG: hypothetical protein LUE10_01100, partial [Alistipes sp.]|nr:hypothetical protein [Alistipes sp.]